MIATIVILLSVCNIATLVLLWSFGIRVNKSFAAVWQAIARVKIEHDALRDAVWEESAESELLPMVAALPSPECNCRDCRKRRQLETN